MNNKLKVDGNEIQLINQELISNKRNYSMTIWFIN